MGVSGLCIRCRRDQCLMLRSCETVAGTHASAVVQLGAVVTFCAVSFIHFCFTLPLVRHQSLFWTLAAIESVLTAVNIAVYLWTCLTDPADPAIIVKDTSLPLFCDTCQVSLSHAGPRKSTSRIVINCHILFPLRQSHVK